MHAHLRITAFTAFSVKYKYTGTLLYTMPEMIYLKILVQNTTSKREGVHL